MSTDFRLYPPQKLALTTLANEILYGGALGGGKSYLLRVASIIYSIEIPGLITYLFRRTFKEVLSNHIHTPGGYLEMLHDLIEAGDVVYSKSDYSFTFWNGSRIQLAHSQYESDIYSHQGAQIGFLIIDEATHFTPMMIRFIRSRVRLGSLSVPPQWKKHFPRILYTSNPGGVGHLYFKSNFVDFGENQIFQAPPDEGKMTRIYIPAKMGDNKVLLANDPDYADRVRGMGDTSLVDAMLEGNWDSLTVGGFSDVWKAKYHVVKPFKIPSSWKIRRGYDYGYSAPAAVVWFAISDGTDFVDDEGNECWVPKGTRFAINELYFVNKRLEGLKLSGLVQGERIKAYERDEDMGIIHPGPADNSIFSREGGPSIADEMLSSGIKFIRSNKSPGSRVLGVQVMRNLLVASTRRPMERPGFFVFNTCFNIIRTLPNLSCDDKNMEDINSMDEDHLWDVIRYEVLHGHKAASSGKVTGT
jgi:hypothetical protein